MAFKTDLKSIKQYSHKIVATLTSIPCFEDPLLVHEIASIIFGFKDDEDDGIVCTVWIVNISNLIRHLKTSTALVVTNFHMYFILLNKFMVYKHVPPKINKGIDKRQTQRWFLFVFH